MQRSEKRILTTHVGSLPRPDDLLQMLVARNEGQTYDRMALARRLGTAITEVVHKQIDTGIDIVNDGELGKPNFSRYVFERLEGFEDRPPDPERQRSMIFGRDMAEFSEYFKPRMDTVRGLHARPFFCNAPLRYVGHAALQEDLKNFRNALQRTKVEEAFLPAVAPGTIEHRMTNDYYPDDEAYLFAVADAMHEEYKAIVDAGFVLQIDDPDLADGWQIHSHMDLSEYRKYAELRLDALNHGLRDIPSDRVRFHMCWGSYHGPHKYDIPLKDIVDLILKVRADTYSLEASNPRHAHEWRVWEEVTLPEGKALIPGVVSHVTDVIEHPDLVADRLIQYARIVGRENVIAGTDCGLGMRVGHPSIVWAKFEAMAEGARLATQKLWAS
jgi:5-methyltetrahydropteroyltriglutamate--homocysteine methyltransferase